MKKENNVLYILRLTFTLLLVTGLVAAALAGVNAITEDRIAAIRAEKIQKKARKAGFDWESVEPVLDKIAEETAELKQAAREGSNVEEELGDLLFAAVKAGGFLGVDSELALHAACEKFIRRFRAVEELADKPLDQLEVPALEDLWRRAKAEEPKEA